MFLYTYTANYMTFGVKLSLRINAGEWVSVVDQGRAAWPLRMLGEPHASIRQNCHWWLRICQRVPTRELPTTPYPENSKATFLSRCCPVRVNFCTVCTSRDALPVATIDGTCTDLRLPSNTSKGIGSSSVRPSWPVQTEISNSFGSVELYSAKDE